MYIGTTHGLKALNQRSYKMTKITDAKARLLSFEKFNNPQLVGKILTHIKSDTISGLRKMSILLAADRLATYMTVKDINQLDRLDTEMLSNSWFGVIKTLTEEERVDLFNRMKKDLK